VHVTSPAGQLCEPEQATSHPHDVPHSIVFWHDCTPVHVTLQRPVPHTTSSHEPFPEHSTLHDVVPAHETPLRQELSESHFTSHAQPAGHATLPLQFEPFWQSMTQLFVATTQLEHGAGHPLLPSTVGGASP